MEMLFDSHAHYDDKAFDSDRHELLQSMPQKGICGIVNAASNIESAKKIIELAEKYSFIYAAAGIHPHDAGKASNDAIDEIKKMCSHKKVVAVGEIGLDYHYDFTDRPTQKLWFERQLNLANELNLPVIVHNREAHMDTLELLQNYRPKGVMHCYSGSVETAKQLLNLGFYIGIGGAVTFKNAKKVIEVVTMLPLSSLLIETDCPYMTPVPFRGKRCDSGHISLTATKIAEIKNVPPEKIAKATRENAQKLFNI